MKRQSENQWTETELTQMEDNFTIEKTTISLQEIYEGITFKWVAITLFDKNEIQYKGEKNLPRDGKSRGKLVSYQEVNHLYLLIFIGKRDSLGMLKEVSS